VGSVGIGSAGGNSGLAVSSTGATGLEVVCASADSAATVQQLTGSQQTTGAQHTGCGRQQRDRHQRQASAELTAIEKTTSATTNAFALRRIVVSTP
jgi:hypothetical protein